MSDIKPKEDEKVELTPTDLEAVHEKAVHEFENEEPIDEPIEEVEKPADEEVVVPPEEEPKVPDAPEPKEEPVVVPPVEEVIPKIKIKDSDGNELEFSSVDEIPDDFEPYSYREFAVGVNKLTVLGIERKESEKKKAADAEVADRNARIDKIKKEWETDQNALIKEGLLDADVTKNTPIIDGVFGVMQDEMNTNGTTLGFRQAYEMYAYRESRKQNQEDVKRKNDEKKRRGSMVQPGGSNTPSAPSSRGRIIEAPPTGISLDQVHEKILGSL